MLTPAASKFENINLKSHPQWNNCPCSSPAAFHLTSAECWRRICEGRCSPWLGETNLWETMQPVSACSMSPLCREFSDWKTDTRASRMIFFFLMYTPFLSLRWRIDLISYVTVTPKSRNGHVLQIQGVFADFTEHILNYTHHALLKTSSAHPVCFFLLLCF